MTVLEALACVVVFAGLVLLGAGCVVVWQFARYCAQKKEARP